MVRKTMNFIDMDGNPVIKTYYFNLTKAEAMKIANTPKFANAIAALKETVNQAKNPDGSINNDIIMGATPEIIELLEEVLTKSYGEKDENGFFVKYKYGRPLYETFMSTPAYSDLFMELISNDVVASEFLNAVIPQSE